MFVKVCGITSIEQIDWAAELGYSAMGVVLHPGSPRYRDFNRASELAAYARGRLISIAVGASFDEVAPCRDDFDFAQVYETCCGERLIYAGKLPPPGPDRPLFLYDASRGSGRPAPLPHWLHDLRERLIISGGLVPATVGAVIREYRPFGVDVSSGVEAQRGVKDYGLMMEFMKEVRHAAG